MLASRVFNRSASLAARARLGARGMAVTTLEDFETYKKWKSDATSPAKVVYFTATWCPPCKMISPIYTQLSDKYSGIAFSKVDVDQVGDAAAEQRIRSIPTFQFYKDGKQVNQLTGADEGALREMLDELSKLATRGN